MVSFFFTPIYMFILVFVVFFGPKKGVLASYSTYWLTHFNSLFWTFAQSTPTTLVSKMRYQFQFTVITSRTTVYVLFAFWCFFFFFGEFLLLIAFNFNTISDLIPSNYFTFFKTHTIFLLDNNNSYLTEVMMFYILFFTTNSFLFLLNLKYSFVYQGFYHQRVLDLILFLALLTLFNWSFLLLTYLSVVLYRINSY
jgi:hypothetical protein